MISSAGEIFIWLEYLCLDSDCRGLGGHELLNCPELLSLNVLDPGGDTPFARAQWLRTLITEFFPPEDEPDLATLHLIGLTHASTRQPRPIRRKLAAEAYGHMALNTFQKHYERALLLDVAEVIWGLELGARKSNTEVVD